MTNMARYHPKYDNHLLQQWSRKDLDQSGLNADHKIDFINNLIKTRFRFDVDKNGRDAIMLISCPLSVQASPGFLNDRSRIFDD